MRHHSGFPILVSFSFRTIDGPLHDLITFAVRSSQGFDIVLTNNTSETTTELGTTKVL
jgi:hypothetical protein